MKILNVPVFLGMLASQLDVHRAETASPDGNLHGLISAHEATLGLIHQFDVSVEVVDRVFLGAPPDAPFQQTATWRWSRKDGAERIRNRDFPDESNPGGSSRKKTLFVDMFQDGQIRKVLDGWDPDHPLELSPIQQHGVKAYQQPPIGDLPGNVSDCPLVFLFRTRDITDDGDVGQSVAQLVATGARAEVRRQTGRAEGAGLQCVRVWRSESGGASPPVNYFDVFLDPRAGMMVRRVVNHHEDYEWPGEGIVIWAEWVYEVMSFRDCGEGVFFPTETEWRVYRAGHEGATSVTKFTTNNLVVNRDLPPDALDFRFPAYALVGNPPKDGRRVVSLWGPDNRRIRDLYTGDDILQAERELHPQALESPRVLSNLVIVNLLVIGAAATILLMRAGRRRNIA